jgi:hypothetical protein
MQRKSMRPHMANDDRREPEKLELMKQTAVKDEDDA